MKAIIALFLCMLFLFVGMPRIRSAPTIEKQSIIIFKNQIVPGYLASFSPYSHEKTVIAETPNQFISRKYATLRGSEKTNFFGSSSGGIGYNCSCQYSIYNLTTKYKNRKHILPFVRNVTFI